jgi:hypothetical protein
MTLPKLPEPDGFRSRYRSDPGMIGHYPWTYADQRRRYYDRPECEYENLFAAEKVRAIQEEAYRAGMAAAVPDGWKVVPWEPDQEMISAALDVEDLRRRGTPETWRRLFREMVRNAPSPTIQAPKEVK